MTKVLSVVAVVFVAAAVFLGITGLTGRADELAAPPQIFVAPAVPIDPETDAASHDHASDDVGEGDEEDVVSEVTPEQARAIAQAEAMLLLYMSHEIGSSQLPQGLEDYATEQCVRQLAELTDSARPVLTTSTSQLQGGAYVLDDTPQHSDVVVTVRTTRPSEGERVTVTDASYIVRVSKGPDGQRVSGIISAAIPDAVPTQCGDGDVP